MRVKILRVAVVGAVLLGATSAAFAGGPETYPLAKVRRGQTGYGMTTMAGTTPERFEFEVVSVAKNFLPKMDIILVKSSDPKLQVTGFWQGMSGSPLYIDGKLACAFSYGFRFNKIALGGCTPIDYMKREGFDAARRGAPGIVDVTARAPGKAGGNKRAAAQPGAVEPRATFSEWQRLSPTGDLGDVLGRLGEPRRSWLLQAPLPSPPARPAAGASDDQTMTASVPLVFSGFSAPAFAEVEQLFGGFPVAPMRAGGTGSGSGSEGPTEFTMGGSIGVVLMRGDMSVAATGTVSYVDDHRVLAFGHPMFQAGEIYAPVATSEVHTVIPSAQSAFVMASPLREIGSLVQDRQSMIMADTHLRSPMIPVDIYISVGEGKAAEQGEFHVQILDNKFFTAMLASMAVGNAVGHYLPDRDHVTARIESMVKVAGAPPLRFVDYLYANDGAASVIGGARALRALVPLLLNPWAPVTVERVEVKVDLRFSADYGEVLELRVPAGELAPGKRTMVDVVIQGWDGKRTIDRVPVDVPRQLAGNIVQLEVAAGDAARLDAAPPVDLPTLIAAFGKLLPGNVYAATLYTADEGAALDGKLVRDLPASAADKLRPGTTTQRVTPYKPMARTTSPAPRVINGGASLLIRVADR